MPRRLLIPALALVALLLLAAPTRADWTWPVSGEVITPYRFGGDPYAAGQHRGIDIAAADGAPVVAAVAGEVRFAGMVGSSGLTISIRTADGRYDTSYLHLSSVVGGRGRAGGGRPARGSGRDERASAPQSSPTSTSASATPARRTATTTHSGSCRRPQTRRTVRAEHRHRMRRR